MVALGDGVDGVGGGGCGCVVVVVAVVIRKCVAISASESGLIDQCGIFTQGTQNNGAPGKCSGPMEFYGRQGLSRLSAPEVRASKASSRVSESCARVSGCQISPEKCQDVSSWPHKDGFGDQSSCLVVPAYRIESYRDSLVCIACLVWARLNLDRTLTGFDSNAVECIGCVSKGKSA